MKRFENKEWKDSMRITFDFNNMMSEFVGEEGFDWEEIETLDPNSKKLLRLWKKREKQGRWSGGNYHTIRKK